MSVSRWIEYKDFYSSLQEVITLNWERYAAHCRGEGQWHNPAEPTLGKTELLWEAVRRHLPRRKGGKSSRFLPLNVYIAIGVNHLDVLHGVDMVFWWQGAYASVDLSVLPKDHFGMLRADLIFTPQDLEPERLDAFGREVAMHLRQFSARKEYIKREREGKIVLQPEELCS